MNDQLFQQLLDSIAQMTETIKKQQETITDLSRLLELEKKHPRISIKENPDWFKYGDYLKTTGIEYLKGSPTSGGYQPLGCFNLGNPPQQE